MQQEPESTLDVIYENWRGHQEKLRNCIEPLTDEQLRVSLIARGYEQARRFSWESTARQVLEVYEEVGRERRSALRRLGLRRLPAPFRS
jgi:glycosyltransferase involved in cell wall biosynthesis